MFRRSSGHVRWALGPWRAATSLAEGSTVREAQHRESLLAVYNRLLRQYPYTTKAIGTAVTYSFSDAAAQWIEEQGKTQQERPPTSIMERLERNAKFSAVGLLWVGPLLTLWFNVMDRMFPGKSPRAVAAKLVIDQVLQGPFMIGTMYIWTSLLSGNTLQHTREKVEQQLWGTWVNSVVVWGPVQIFQQTVVPLHYRVLVANFVSFFWDTYLSLKMMDGGEAHDCDSQRLTRKITSGTGNAAGSRATTEAGVVVQRAATAAATGAATATSHTPDPVPAGKMNRGDSRDSERAVSRRTTLTVRQEGKLQRRTTH